MKKSKNKLMQRVLVGFLAVALIITAIPMAYQKVNAETDVTNIARDLAETSIDAETPQWIIDGGAWWMYKTVLVDGNKTSETEFYTSAFATDKNTTKTIAFSYGDRAAYVEKLVLYPHVEGGVSYGFPESYSVTVWDGEKWVEVARRSGQEDVKEPQEVLVGKTCNFIKITADVLGPSNNSNEPYCLQLTEIEVMGRYEEGILLPPGNVAPDAVAFAEKPGWTQNWMAPDMLNNKLIKDGCFYTSEYVDDQSTEKTVEFVFENQYNMNEVVLYPRTASVNNGFPQEFKVEVSNDSGETWTKVATGTATPNENGVVEEPVKVTFDETATGDRVRITATKLGKVDAGTQYALQLEEVVIIGDKVETPVDPGDPSDPSDPSEPAATENVAPTATIKAETPNWVLDWMKFPCLVDGNKKDGFYTSEFETNQNTAKVIQFNFEKSYRFDRVVLSPAIDGNKKVGFPVDLSVNVWDGSKWVEVANLKGITMTDNYEIKFPFIEGNAVALKVTKLGKTSEDGKYALMLAETEIYGKETQTVLNPAEDMEVPGAPDNPDPEPAATDNVAPAATIKAETPGWVLDWMKSPCLVDGNKKDGFYTSEFETNQNTAKVIQFNFEKSYRFDRVVLSPAIDNGKKVGFPVDLSVNVWDGSKWVEVANLKGITMTDNYEITFPFTEGNAVALKVTKLGKTGNAGEYALMLAETEIYGKETETVLSPAEDMKVPSTPGGGSQEEQPGAVGNVASLGTIEAEVPGWVSDWMKPSMLVDGNANDGFYTSEFMDGAGVTKIIQFNFKEAYKFSQVILYPAKDGGKKAGFPVDFTVSVWNGSNWVVVANVKNAAISDSYGIDFDAIEGNAVRLTVTKLGETTQAGKYALMLAEMKIFGAETGKTLPAAPSSGVGDSASGGSSSAEDSKGLFDSSRNVAKGCPVLVSSDFRQYSCDKENLTDGKAETFWATNGQKYKSGKEEWAEVNLLENYKINKIILLARPEGWGFPNDFQISIFYDGKWTEVINETGYKIDESTKNVAAYEFSIPETIGNKIRISSKNYRDAGVDKIFCLNELVVYGTAYPEGVIPNDNLVLINSTVTTSSSIEDYAYYRQNLNDGDYQSEWSSVTTSNATEENWIEVEFTREFPVSEIQLKPAWGGNGFPVDFSIQVCEKGKWVTIYTAENYEKPVDEAIQRFQFETMKATGIRVVTNKMERFGGLYSVKLAEIMAYRQPVGDDFDLDALEGGAYSQEYVATSYKGVLYDENGNIVDAEGNILIPASFFGASSPLTIVLIVVGILAILGSTGAIVWLNWKKKNTTGEMQKKER